MPQFQAFTIALLIVDSFVVIAALLLGNYITAVDGSAAGAGVSSGSIPSESFELLFGLLSLQVVLDALLAFTSFTLVFFSFEVGLVLIAFRGRTSGHWGYLLDAVLVSTQVYGEIFGWGLSIHLLNVFRYWRLLRMTAYLIGRETHSHDNTKADMAAQAAVLAKTQNDHKRGQLDLVREKEARTAVDEMLLSYKEEVDTLNEALKIAAMDIAEVAEADDDLLSDEDDDFDETLPGLSGASEVDDEGYSDAAGSLRDKAMNKASMLREARKDNSNSSLAGSTASAASSGTKKSQGAVTFKVNADGSYEQR